MTKTEFKKKIDEVKKQYKTAQLIIDNNKLILKNKFTGVLHTFPDGRKQWPIPQRDIGNVYEWIK